MVVFLDSAPERHLYRNHYAISQGNRVFSPRVTVVVKGSTVDFPNDDTIFHNIFSLSTARPFDLDIYPPWGLEVGYLREAGMGEVVLQHPSQYDSPRDCPG